MDREVAQAHRFVGKESATRTAWQPDDLAWVEWNRGQLCLQGSTAVKDMDQDVECWPDVFLDLTTRSQVDDVRIEVSLLRLELPD